MRHLALTPLALVAVLLIASEARARPGFYIGLGLGPTNVSGEVIASSRLQPSENGTPPPAAFTTDFASGMTGNFRLGFNILGYAAVETQLTGSSDELFDADRRAWLAQWHTGVRAYPAWHWQRQLPPYLQPLEPSIFFGLGTTYQAYNPLVTSDEVGYGTWGSWRIGLGLEYFVITYFKVGLEYSYTRANYDTFIYNFEDSIDFPIDPVSKTGFHQLFLLGMFQFGPAQEPVRYAP